MTVSDIGGTGIEVEVETSEIDDAGLYQLNVDATLDTNEQASSLTFDVYVITLVYPVVNFPDYNIATDLV